MSSQYLPYTVAPEHLDGFDFRDKQSDIPEATTGKGLSFKQRKMFVDFVNNTIAASAQDHPATELRDK